ncbi:Ca-activated chloride channel family protein [Catenuloplanes nepalensis]|uniref:Ca-activated chloride channel family protein n=1 Tax=Catenuloplanes nepalensis TaxID=587533 RepID=A0ABT9MWU9_9ACTN|nr:VWA domain-containing protein [Catenuloplanes nepalensis]MDP9795486.1 Ca-activated chloride channel family protein [Catenuloplanes nepalensis]
MTVLYPAVLLLAVLLTAGAIAAYVMLARRRTRVLVSVGLASAGDRRAAVRRHLPWALLLAALPIMLVGLARPEAEVAVPRVAGTVILAFDISNSMAADDVGPTRLAAAQAAAGEFVRRQPESVDVGVVVFGDQALNTQAPTDDHALAIAAIDRAKAGGGTSLGQAIMVSLGAITGKPMVVPDDGPPPDLGYWPSATIVIFSDGEETGGPDVEEAAALAAAAGVRIQTVGVGTPEGATVEVDGYRLTTALDETLLTAIAQVSGGQYHTAGDAEALADTTGGIDLRLTTKKEPVELTAPFAGAALLLLAVGALLSTRWHGRII